MPYGDEFISVFRGEQTNGIPYIYMGRSKDAIHWDFDENKIPFVDENGNPFMPKYAYDPRLVKVEDTYYNRYQNVLAQINQENSMAEQVRQYNEKMAEERRQYNETMAFQKKQAEQSLNLIQGQE